MPDGKTISWSQKNYSKEYATFQLPCGKCLSCRLAYARQWAIRCVHEAQMHEKNCFITLTYDEKNLVSKKLVYKDFQEFQNKLRNKILRDFIKEKFGPDYWKKLSKEEKSKFRKEHKDELDKIKISIFVTGEYGDQNKRPHWHACIFNWSPTDGIYKYSNGRGDKVYTSKTLEELWGKGMSEYGSVTLESAGYCARYAAKKLVHGHDQEHDYQPISKKSARNAIGKKWLEKYWPDVFNYGHIVLPNGSTCSIPRYYEKWLKKNKPEEWEKYVTKTKLDKTSQATITSKKIEDYRFKRSLERGIKGFEIDPKKVANQILKRKFKRLNEKAKL